MDIATRFKNYLSVASSMPNIEDDLTEIFSPYVLFRHHENDQVIITFIDFSFFTIKKGEFPITFNLQENSLQDVPKNLRNTISRALKTEADNLLTQLEKGALQ
jgi:hypothetical protein